MSRWSSDLNDYVNDSAVEDFIDELLEVCRRHGMTLGHEDEHGAFMVERPFTEDRADWLRTAHIARPRDGFDKDGLVDVNPEQR